MGGALDWDGFAHTLDAAGVTTAQSTATTAWSFIPGSKAGTPSTTGGISNWAASTWTDSNTAGSGTATSWVAHAFQRPTLASSNALVATTDAATVYVANSPLAGTNDTLTNAWALWIDAGNVRFDDNIYWLSGTSFKGILDHANAADRTYTFPDATGNIPTVAAQSDVNAMTSTTMALSPNHIKAVLGTMVATTSGTSVAFTGIPSGVSRVIVEFAGVSLSGTDDILVQIGPSGGVESSGYVSAAVRMTAAPAVAITSSTSGFVVKGDASTYVTSGHLILQLMDASTNKWSASGTYQLSTATMGFSGGDKALAGVLSKLTILTTGANTFDAGAVNISYER